MVSSRSARASRAHDAAPSRADDSEDKGGGLPGEHDAGDGKKKISRKKILVVTHRGATLTERVVDAYTTEYRVTRSVRAVVLSSYAPAWCVLAVALAATEWTVATKRDGAGDGWIGKFRETKLAWFAVAAFAIATRVMANTVVAESLVVMRHVGVRLSSHSLVPLRKKGKTKFLDVDRLKSIVVNEALGAKGVCVVLCFRFFGDGDDHGEHVSANSFGDTMHTEKGCTTPTEKQSNSLTTPQNRRVALVFPALRPGLPIIKQVYRSAHAALFSEEDGDDDDENSKSQTDDNSESFRCLPGPASGHGWWRGRDGKENCGGDDEFEGLFEEEAMNTTAKDGAPNGPSVSARKQTETQKNRHSILMVSDFFLPNLGGVEVHMFSLAQRLLERGHRVTVLTHAYGNRCGVRYMTNGLKVYYAFRVPVYAGCTCPDLFGNFKLQRQIMLREKITLVHAHQTFSVMGHEAIFHARTMGYKCVFTDHSLFGFSDTSAIHMNKLLVLTLADCNHVICVSHVAKENTVLRSGIPPKRVSVVPNAVDHVRFKPDDVPPGSNSNRVVVAVTARLARRKGVHLLAAVIPNACAAFPEVDFLIAGDGPMRGVLETIVKEHGLTKRVTLLGAVGLFRPITLPVDQAIVQYTSNTRPKNGLTLCFPDRKPHGNIASVLKRARIFLNCSLTESFCIAILEAACAGCLVVATKVGGVPEVLPPDLLFLAEPDPRSLVEALAGAIKALNGARGEEKKEVLSKSRSKAKGSRGKEKTQHGVPCSAQTNNLSPISIHERVRAMYSWDDVAERVEVVYGRARGTRDSRFGRFVRLKNCGGCAGPLFAAVAAVDYLYWRYLEWVEPGGGIDAAPEYVPDGEREGKRGG